MILLLNEYASFNQKDGSFLNMMDLKKFDFYFNDATDSAVMGGYSILKPFSIAIPKYGENNNVADKCSQAFLTALHELNHAFQFGIPIKSTDDTALNLMSKTIMPIGYIMNNLITKLIDNSVINWIMLKIYHLIGKKDINPDDVHVPFLYKFTIEHDSDKFTDMNKKANEFINKINKCVAAVRYINRQTASLDRCPIKEREERLSNATEQLGKYIEENGEYFIGLAMKIVNLYDSK
jgi:hypothetical protein